MLKSPFESDSLLLAISLYNLKGYFLKIFSTKPFCMAELTQLHANSLKS